MFIVHRGKVRLTPACLQDSKLLCVLEHVSPCEVQETCESERTMHGGYERSSLPCKAWAEVCANATHKAGHS